MEKERMETEIKITSVDEDIEYIVREMENFIGVTPDRVKVKKYILEMRELEDLGEETWPLMT